MKDFLSLPAETRCRIYECYFADRQFSWLHGRSKNYLLDDYENIAIILVNKQISSEAHLTMMKMARLDLTSMYDRYYKVLHPAVLELSLLQRVYMDVPHRDCCFHKIVRKMTTLKSLVLGFSFVSIYDFVGDFSVTGLPKTELDYIQRDPWRIVGDDMDKNDGHLRSRRTHRVPTMEEIVKIWKERSRSFKLMTRVRLTNFSAQVEEQQFVGVSERMCLVRRLRANPAEDRTFRPGYEHAAN